MAARKKTTAAADAAQEVVTVDAVVSAEEVVAKKAAPKKAAAKAAPTKPLRVHKEIDPNTIVPVRNGFHGPLGFYDKVTGEQHKWSEFGAELDLTVAALKRARGSNPRFFSENWWLIEDPEILEYLRVTQFYANALTCEEFDELFTLSPEEVELKVSKLSRGQQRGVAYRAKEKIESRELADLNVIRALEKVLDTTLIEK